jgi:hypothetical protein
MENIKTQFIYCIDLDNPMTCNNLVEARQLSSYEFNALHSGLAFKKISEISIEDLKYNAHNQSIGLASYRWSILMGGSILRNGGKFGLGYKYPRWFSQNQCEHIEKVSSIEIEFERVRRDTNPNLPSRLTCLFLAEDTIDSRIHLSQMLGHLIKPHIINVEINYCLKSFKTDSKYFDNYFLTGDVKFIHAYWKAEIENASSVEYLFEGSIIPSNEEQIAHVINCGSFEAPEKPA